MGFPLLLQGRDPGASVSFNCPMLALPYELANKEPAK